MRNKKIVPYEECAEKLKAWNQAAAAGRLTEIYFDSEDIWLEDRQPADIIDFDWDRSDYNIKDELLKKVYAMSSEEINELSGDKKQNLLSEIDFMDAMEWRNEILFAEYNQYISSINWKKY
jgi:hypothetical protein